MTLISVEQVREACGITKWTIPNHLYGDHIYDKWGNPILSNGQRMVGELFYDASVQKILERGGVLGNFTEYVKYQRTFHMPFSPGIHSDDKALESMSLYEDEEVVLSIKYDGECTAMYPNYIHARSIDGRSHPSRDWVKQFHSQIAWQIPQGFRIYGENLYAKHSIKYNDLDSFFYGFQVWDRDTCLSWDDTLEYFELLGIRPVDVLYRGPFDLQKIRDVLEALPWDTVEGGVLRVARPFKYGEFKNCVCKYVRVGHIQTTKHWFHGQAVTPNELAVPTNPDSHRDMGHTS